MRLKLLTWSILAASLAASPSAAESLPLSGKVVFSDQNFAPVEGRVGAPLVATIQPFPNAGKILSWEMTVYDPGATAFISFKGEWPKASVEWDGRGADGDLVESSAPYTFVARLRDASGQVSEARGTLTTGIVLLQGAARYRIGISSIVFKPNTPDYRDVEPEQLERNLKTIGLLAAKLRHFAGYTIRIEGHAVLTNWRDKAKARAEQRDSLIPLSAARAEAIKKALVAYDIPAGSITAIGVGAEDPVVPDSDVKNRWKNRRVEIYLERQEG
jgi:hypothetical protein